MPIASIDQMQFRIAPHVIYVDGRYFLEYQIAVTRESPQVRYVLGYTSAQDKGYYFFEGVTSFPEYGEAVQRPLEADGMEPYAESNSIFWLNPDGSELQLTVLEAP